MADSLRCDLSLFTPYVVVNITRQAHLDWYNVLLRVHRLYPYFWQNSVCGKYRSGTSLVTVPTDTGQSLSVVRTVRAHLL